MSLHTVSDVILQAPDASAMKQCSVCQSTTTPNWRKGINGEVLCNSCGVKSELRRKLLPHDADEIMDVDKKDKKSSVGSKNGPVGGACYYCKWCQKTWAISAFPSRQSFGAHCSNCSRKRRSKVDLPPPMQDASGNYISAGGASGQDSDVNDDEYMNPPPAKHPKLYGSSSFLEEANDSDSDTVSNSAGFSRLLSAVESVLNEERELDLLRAQLRVMRQNVAQLDDTHKRVQEDLSKWMTAQLEHLKRTLGSMRQKLSPADIAVLGIPTQNTAAIFGAVPFTPVPAGTPAAPLVTFETIQATEQLMHTADRAFSVIKPVDGSTDSLEILKAKFQQLFTQKKILVTQELDAINEFFVALKVRQKQQAQAAAAAAAVANTPGFVVPQPLNVEHLLNQRVQQAAKNIRQHFIILNRELYDRIEAAKQQISVKLNQYTVEFEEKLTSEESRLLSRLDEMRQESSQQFDDFATKLAALVSSLGVSE